MNGAAVRGHFGAGASCLLRGAQAGCPIAATRQPHSHAHTGALALHLKHSDPASLLAQEVAAKYAGKVTFVSENFGDSKLADRFGVKGYPAIFWMMY